MLYTIISEYLSGKKKKVDGGSYNREEVLRGLNRALGPIFLPGVTEAYVNKCCPEGQTLTDAELEEVLDEVSNLAKQVWEERFIARRFSKEGHRDG